MMNEFDEPFRVGHQSEDATGRVNHSCNPAERTIRIARVGFGRTVRCVEIAEGKLAGGIQCVECLLTLGDEFPFAMSNGQFDRIAIG
jgi:hypothetical protein